MAGFNKFDCFVEDAAEGKHNLASDTLMVMLSNVAPLAANAVYGDITQIVSGNGYTTGGKQAAQVSSSQTGGLYKLVLSSPAAWTGGPAAMATARYVVLYNDTSATKPLIGWWDYGAGGFTLNAGETFTATMDAVNGVLQLQ